MTAVLMHTTLVPDPRSGGWQSLRSEDHTPLTQNAKITPAELPHFIHQEINNLLNCSAIFADGVGGWSSEGCRPDPDRSTSTNVVCLCNHLTSFSILLVSIIYLCVSGI